MTLQASLLMSEEDRNSIHCSLSFSNACSRIFSRGAGGFKEQGNILIILFLQARLCLNRDKINATRYIYSVPEKKAFF